MQKAWAKKKQNTKLTDHFKNAVVIKASEKQVQNWTGMGVLTKNVYFLSLDYGND